MSDCSKGEMRDRLPDLANETLVLAEREIVLAHLVDCPDCTAEIEILRTTRLILLATTPKVNVAGIVSALPQYGVKSIATAPSVRRSSWANWRVAAAATFLAASIGSYELLNKDSSVRTIDTIAAVTRPDTTAGLAPTGALTGMSDDELNALAKDIANIEALPSTEIETTTSRVAVPSILPDSAVRDLEVR